ncbi:nucleotide-binding protein [bacterium]|nr:nucleotide-binding protein [bacterium]
MTKTGISILEGLFEKSSEDIYPRDTNSLKKEFIKKVFIVHGHDEEMKQAVARYFEKAGFEAIILHEKPNSGRTIIEKINDYSDVPFAAVILSPDDVAYSGKDKKYRARQNVIFELGFFIGKLGRENVFPIYKNDSNIELPSDYDGVIYIPYDKSSNDWKVKLCQELKACDCGVDMDKIFLN